MFYYFSSRSINSMDNNNNSADDFTKYTLHDLDSSQSYMRYIQTSSKYGNIRVPIFKLTDSVHLEEQDILLSSK